MMLQVRFFNLKWLKIGALLHSRTLELHGSKAEVGKAYTVDLPASSPLAGNEGLSHVIHVLGPNMNPTRPNFLNNDYHKGCKLLYDSYVNMLNEYAGVFKLKVEEI